MDSLPASKEGRAAVRSRGSKTFPGILVGYHPKVGGQWSGDLYVVSLSDIKGNNDHKPHCKRIQASDVYINQKKGTEKTLAKVFSSQSRGLKRDMEKTHTTLKNPATAKASLLPTLQMKNRLIAVGNRRRQASLNLQRISEQKG